MNLTEYMSMKMIEKVKDAVPNGSTHCLFDSGGQPHYLKFDGINWYSWGYKTPNSKTRTQWNLQNTQVIEYFMESVICLNLT